MDGKLLNWFSTWNHLGFHSITLLLSLYGIYSLSFHCLSWRPAPPTTSKMILSGCGFRWKKIAGKLEMGLDAQKSFAQMHEDGNVNKEIGVQVMKLDPIVTQEPKEEK